MKKLILLLGVASLWASNIALADPVDPYPDGIGIYFDTDATQYCTDWSGGMIQAYVVLTSITEPSGVSGFECRLEIDVPAGSYLFGYTLPPGSINVDSAPSFMVGMSTPLPWQPAIVVVTITMLETAGDPWTFEVHPYDDPSIEGVPVYAAGDNPSRLTALRVSSGDSDSPVALLNNGCEPEPCDYAFEEAAFAPGTGTDQTSALNMLGPPDGVAVALGLEGSVVLELPYAVVDGLGSDFRIHEIGAGQGEIDENFRVEASSDGLNFVQVSNAPGGTVDFDLAGLGIDNVFYLRITDLLPQEGGTSPPAVGADIDAVELLRCGDQNCPHGDFFADCRLIESSGILFGERYSFDANDIPLPIGESFFYDSTLVTVTREADDLFLISGAPDHEADWICADWLYVNGVQSADLGFDYIEDPTLPLCKPVTEIYVPAAPRNITDLIPLGTSCVEFRLAEAFRDIYGNTEIYLIKQTIVPAFLSIFDVRPEAGKMVIRWKALSAEIHGSFVLVARQESEEREVPHRTDANGLHTAIDQAPQLYAGGTVTYSLYHQQDEDLQLVERETFDLDWPELALATLRVHPNPFNPQASIFFDVRKPQRVKIAIYDMTGRWVAELTDQMYGSGEHSVEWQGKDSHGRAVASGTYLVQMLTPTAVESQKIMLLR